jgi:hypothetical protein
MCILIDSHRRQSGPQPAANPWQANDLWTAVQRLSPIQRPQVREYIYVRYFSLEISRIFGYD